MDKEQNIISKNIGAGGRSISWINVNSKLTRGITIFMITNIISKNIGTLTIVLKIGEGPLMSICTSILKGTSVILMIYTMFIKKCTSMDIKNRIWIMCSILLTILHITNTERNGIAQRGS